jgi:hypothetical protein
LKSGDAKPRSLRPSAKVVQLPNLPMLRVRRELWEKTLRALFERVLSFISAGRRSTAKSTKAIRVIRTRIDRLKKGSSVSAASEMADSDAATPYGSV